MSVASIRTSPTFAQLGCATYLRCLSRCRAETAPHLRGPPSHRGFSGSDISLTSRRRGLVRSFGLPTLTAARTLPVVILTSSAAVADLVRSYELGANSYIFKPVDFQKLMGEVARLGYNGTATNRQPPADGQPVVAGERTT